MKEIERVKQGEKIVDGALTYNMIESIIRMILKNTEYMKFAVPVFNSSMEDTWKSDREDGETPQCVDAGLASALSPTQLNADSRES